MSDILVNIAESYLATVVNGDSKKLIELLGEDGLVEDPRFPGIKGAEAIQQFVSDFGEFVNPMSPRVEHLRTSATEKRVLCEDILHLQFQGESLELPVATVVANDETGGFTRVHVYYTNWPFNKKHSKRRNLYKERLKDQAEFEGAILNYVQCLLSGDLEKIRDSFEADIYFREASGPPYVHWGRNAVVDYFRGLFSRGAPMLRDDTVSDDGRTVFMEFTPYGWAGQEWDEKEWEAGLAAYERSRDGLICAIRIYDDVDFA